MTNFKMYKFEIIEVIIKALDFKTKEEVIRLAKKMLDIANSNKSYSKEIKGAFKEAYEEIISEDLTLDNLYEIKKLLN